MSEPLDRQPERVETPDYLRVIRARAWVIVLAVVVVFGATMVLSLRSTPEYKAASQLVFQPDSLDQSLFGTQLYDDSNQPRDVETGAELVKVGPVAEGVKQQLKAPLSTVELLAMVDVSTSSDNNVLQITATSSSPVEAADVANAFAEQFVAARIASDKATVEAASNLVKQQLDGLTPQETTSDYAQSLKDKYADLQILEAMQTGDFKIVQTAAAPSAPVSPKPKRDGLLALAVGLILGLGLAFFLDHVDKRIRDVKSLERIAGMPVLATVPNVGGRLAGLGRLGRLWGPADAKTAIGFANEPILLESFRILRSSLKYFDLDDGGKNIKTILVASGESGQGKTVSAINLALTLTIAGNRVVLVDADLRHPKVEQHLGLRPGPGLSTVLSNGKTFMDVLQPVNVPAFVPNEIRERVGTPEGTSLQAALFCLTSGPLPPNPAEVLASGRMEALIRELELDEMVDYVVIDSAPLLTVADALAIAPKVDAVLIAARINRITRDEVQQVKEQLSRSGARVIGLVAGGVKAKPSPYYHKHTSTSTAAVKG